MTLGPIRRSLPRMRGAVADQGLVVVCGELRGNPLLQLDDLELGLPLRFAVCRSLQRCIACLARFHEDTSFGAKEWVVHTPLSAVGARNTPGRSHFFSKWL